MMALLIIMLGIHLTYYVFLFSRLINISHIPNPLEKSRPHSIVVCFKNADSLVDRIVPILMTQASDDIVLVDDFSDDDTFQKLQYYSSERVQVIKASIDRPGKKQAAHDGISMARHNRILVTDADCMPKDHVWSSHMNAVDKKIVLGYSPMIKTPGMVNLFSRFETYMTGVQYLSYAVAGIPYMGVGRNMVLDRSLRNENLNLIKGQKLASGDDDLTVNAIATKDNTWICIDPNSIVYTESATTLRAFINQKTRHISTSVHYKLIHQCLLGLFSLSQVLFYLLLIGGLLSGTIPLQVCLVAYGVKQCVQIIVHHRLTKKLQESIGLHQHLLLDLLLFLYYLVMPFILLIRKNNNHWS
jgi:glycosyltransferase involved in cell wall biosynthesis